jgi:hypothetical protein
MPEKDLEDFIRQHRSEFESHGPAPDLWAKIEEQLTPVKKKATVIQLIGRHWLKAAVVLVLVVNSFMLYQFLRMRQTPHLSNVAPEVQDAKAYYTSQIEQRLDAIKAYPPSVLGLDSAARRELELRNDTYQALETALIQNPGNERIKAAMIRYYQLKLDLLDKILDELKEKQPVVKKNSYHESEL